MRPNYFVIGAQKCATSSLCELLGQHPDVFMTSPKEPYFFSHDEVWARGWDWYESLFAAAEGRRAIGEGSTTYSQKIKYPRAAPRIIEHCPDARLIYIVRDPLARIESHWIHLRSQGGRESLPFAEAVRARTDYIDHSRYDAQLAVYRAHFPDDRILVLFFEDFRRDPAAVLARCFGFLDVAPDTSRLEDPDRPRHVSAGARVDGPLLTAARRIPGFRRLRDALDEGARDRLRRIMKRPVGARPAWDPDLRAWAIERLADDAQTFLARYGKPGDWWPSMTSGG